MTVASPLTYTQRSESYRCDECGKEMAVPLFCDHCGSDYPERRRMSPFAIIGLATTFALDDAQLSDIDICNF